MIAQEAQREKKTLSHPKRADIKASANENDLPESASPAEVAEYMVDLLEGARQLAGKSGLTFLAYLIQVAVEEAKIQVGEPKDGSS